MKKNFTLFILLLAITTGFSQTWNGSISANWDVAGNWTPAGVPTSGSNVTIPGALAVYPVLASNVTINSITMQEGSRLDVKGYTLSLEGVNTYIFFTGAALNNSDAASDIVININTGVNGYATYFRGNTVNDNIIFNLTGSNQFFEGDAGNLNLYNANAAFNVNGTLPLGISTSVASQFNGNLTINRTTAGPASLFGAGGTVNGNFNFTNNAGGSVALGTLNTKTGISGTVSIAVNHTSGNPFDMLRVINQLNGGSISVQSPGAFHFEADTLKVTSLSISGYQNNYGYFYNNSIVGNTSIADDNSSGQGYATYVRNNQLTGTSSFTNNGTNNFYEADAPGYENHYIGNTTFTATNSGGLYVNYGGASVYDGNLAFNRTAPGITQVCNGGGTINGNFSYTNNTSGYTSLGNTNIKTSISGTVNITAGYTTPNTFSITRLINQTTGGTISIQNTYGFSIQYDTLKLAALTVSDYKMGGYGYLFNNDITGNITVADDVTYGGGYATYIRANKFTGNAIFTNNGTNNLYEADNGAGSGTTYTGNVTFNGAGPGALYISHLDASQFQGNLAINRTAAGHTQAFNGGSSVSGNFSYTNNAGGNTYFGNAAIKTSITGAISIAVNHPSPASFEMNHLVNQAAGGSINLQNTGGFNLRNDTLIVVALGITGYYGSAYGFFLNNDVTGNLTIADDASYGGGYATYIRSSIIKGNTSITNNGSNIAYDADQPGSGNKYMGNVTYARNGGGLNVAGGDFNEITRNLALNSNTTIPLGKLKFNGSTDGTIEQLGTYPLGISELTMQKTGAGKITLNDTLNISNALVFNGGIIFSNTASNLSFADNATCTGASDASYVDGPVTKTGDDAFTFPLGKSSEYAPIGITAPTQATDVFRAQYFRNIPHTSGYDSTQKDQTLHHISSREYWLLDRTAGSSNVKVTLSWDTDRSGIVNSMSDLRVARWNGSSWKDEGNGGTVGNDEGSILSSNTISAFSPFTLASATPLNPLPVKITGYKVVRAGNAARISWSISNETGVDHFEIEKSANGYSFASLQIVKARGGNSNNDYEALDNAPLPGKNHYRLKMTGNDGEVAYSKIIPIDFSVDDFISLYPNPARSSIRIYTVQLITVIEVIDISGKIVKKLSPSPGGQYNISDLKQGIYFLKIKSPGETTMIPLSKL